MNKKWQIAESIVFLIFAIANAYPFIAYHFFVTLDGPPHLYNSHCIKEILLGNEYLQGFIQLNPFPNPNWTGHFIMALANLFLPGWLAEKTFLLIYIICLPYAFRHLVKTLMPQNYLASYLIFPFCYTYMFFLGFYNFSISLVFLFFTIAFWIRNKDKLNIYKIILMMLLITATYFSHASIYGILLPILFGLLFIDETLHLVERRKNIREYFRSMFIKTGVLILSYIITAWWTIQFFLSKPPSVNAFLPKSELFRNIRIIHPIIGFIQSAEEQYTKKIFYVLIFLTLVVLIKRIINLIFGAGFSLKRPWDQLKKILNKGDLWLGFSVLLLVAYYVLPDSDGWAGYFSLRILLLFFLLYLVWLATQQIPRFFLLISIPVMLYFYIQLTISRDKTSSCLNKAAIQCNKASEFIHENSTVFPVNCSGNWLYGHFDKYLGIDKPLVILDNNECNQNYFPLVWNEKKIPQIFLDETGEVDRCYISPMQNRNGRLKVNYLFIIGQPDTNISCDKKLYELIQRNCKKVYSDGLVYLYENK